MKKKSYLRFFVKHLIPWVLAAAIASFFIMYMIASPSSSYTTYTASYTTGSLVEMLERGDRPQKDIITLSEISNTLDSAYILYDNETNAIVCDSSAAVHLTIVQKTGDEKNVINLYSDDEELLRLLYPFQKPNYNFVVTADDVYVSKNDPTQFVLGKFTVDAYQPGSAGKEYHASYDTTPQNKENYTHYTLNNSDAENLTADNETCSMILVYTGGTLKDSSAMKEVYRYCEYANDEFSGNQPEKFAPALPAFAQLAELSSTPIANSHYTLYAVQFHYWYADIMMKLVVMCAVFLLIAILLALLTAHISYARYCKNYEIDEYRRNLTSLLAHDLKSPLAVISGYAENLRDNVGTDKREHYADAIVQKTQYMDELIADVLDLAKTEDMTATSKSMVDLMKTAEKVFSNLHERIDEKELTLSFEGNCTLKANEALMMQALSNLAVNAVKFTPSQGKITVTGFDSGIRFTNDTEGTIENTAALAEPFVMGDNSRTSGSGSGLGLSIVRNIASMQKLHLKLRSDEGWFSAELKR